MKLNAKILQQVIAQDYGLKAVTELKFHPERKWRFDLAIPSIMLAIEFEGGVWTNGRHTRGKGFLGDIEKYNEAAIHGWTVMRFTHTGHTHRDVLQAISKIISRETLDK